jgi:hypothetical protein
VQARESLFGTHVDVHAAALGAFAGLQWEESEDGDA